MNSITVIDYRREVDPCFEAERIICQKMDKVQLKVLELNSICRQYFQEIRNETPRWRFEFFRTNSLYKFRRITIKPKEEDKPDEFGDHSDWIITDETLELHQLNMTLDVTSNIEVNEHPDMFSDFVYTNIFDEFIHHIQIIINVFQTAYNMGLPSVYDCGEDDEDDELWSDGHGHVINHKGET